MRGCILRLSQTEGRSTQTVDPHFLANIRTLTLRMLTTYMKILNCPLAYILTALVLSASMMTDVVGHSAEQKNKSEAVADIAALKDTFDMGAERGLGDARAGHNLLVALVAEDEFDDFAVAGREAEFGGDFVPFVVRQRERRESRHVSIPPRM
jgi:hypothetical protein